ncbi:hypothetical protein NSND_50169 [Nitrospira sp. ND1]|nr:hypothetical protein NSND_50169 [Nitrospira sp. ND1]
MSRDGSLARQNQLRELGIDAFVMRRREHQQRRGEKMRDLDLDLGRHGGEPIRVLRPSMWGTLSSEGQQVNLGVFPGY